ncbi:hypothetical protein VTI28DRAFT_9336 [Corynascus sepedonium]
MHGIRSCTAVGSLEGSQGALHDPTHSTVGNSPFRLGDDEAVGGHPAGRVTVLRSWRCLRILLLLPGGSPPLDCWYWLCSFPYVFAFLR